MSTPPAGTTKKRTFSRNDYLAPLPIPTGRKPSDVLNTIWRKNEVFLDIGSYSIGSAVMVLWPMVLLFALLNYITPDPLIWGGGLIIVGIPILLVVYGLFREVPLPVRFNRQRREVCVPRDDGEYWIVPWETVTAAATQHSSVSQAGKATMGLLIIGFENPDPQAKEDDKHFSLGFNCGGGTTAMALWECMRSYMEIGPEAVEDQTARFDRSKGIWATYLDDLVKAAKLRGWPLTILWEGFCGIFIF
ncbi:DUF6708 domain-containing protein, partial [Pseudomonas sp. AL03]|uniref:DUF6708 domain-containing protein n=1 Tax=Pseudomonas sp. AL03 TaxID=3042230 RepID=UPI00249CF052